MADDMQSFNDQIIEEFRSNEGRVGGTFRTSKMLLLHSRGAKSGEVRIHPMVFMADGDRYVVFASKGGGPTNPAWYHNLVAHPEATIEVGTEEIAVVARVATGQERTRIWSAQKAAFPAFADYEARTTREIPVVVLERTS
jgi:deazaflavin-dependent oxidoreductase (nitroreductase family)